MSKDELAWYRAIFCQAFLELSVGGLHHSRNDTYYHLSLGWDLLHHLLDRVFSLGQLD